MAVGDAYVFPGFLTPVLTQLFFPKPPTTFLTCFCRGERRKYAGKKSCLNRASNSQSPGHESDTLTTEPPGRGMVNTEPDHNYTVEDLYITENINNNNTCIYNLGLVFMFSIKQYLYTNAHISRLAQYSSHMLNHSALCLCCTLYYIYIILLATHLAILNFILPWNFNTYR